MRALRQCADLAAAAGNASAISKVADLAVIWQDGAPFDALGAIDKDVTSFPATSNVSAEQHVELMLILGVNPGPFQDVAPAMIWTLDCLRLADDVYPVRPDREWLRGHTAPNRRKEFENRSRKASTDSAPANPAGWTTQRIQPEQPAKYADPQVDQRMEPGR